MLDATNQQLDKPLYQKALQLLARREHSVYELQSKLLSKSLSFTASVELGESERRSAVERVCQKLVSDGYLSDLRFAQAYARARSNSGFGALRISRELQIKGVDSGLAATVIEQLSDRQSPMDAMYRVWQKKFRNPPQDPKEKSRQIRFLMYRGFSHEAIGEFFRFLQHEVRLEST